MTLPELLVLLQRLASGELTLVQLRECLAPVLASDPLDVEESDSTPWDHAHDDARLFWRIAYLVESEADDEADARRWASRIADCAACTDSAGTAFELLPLILDQDRFTTIVARHLAGIISRTGFLNVVAESGYPPHAKLWLRHASPASLQRLADELVAHRYRQVASSFERSPD